MHMHLKNNSKANFNFPDTVRTLSFVKVKHFLKSFTSFLIRTSKSYSSLFDIPHFKIGIVYSIVTKVTQRFKKQC